MHDKDYLRMKGVRSSRNKTRKSSIKKDKRLSTNFKNKAAHMSQKRSSINVKTIEMLEAEELEIKFSSLNPTDKWYHAIVPFRWIHICLNHGTRHRGVHKTKDDIHDLESDKGYDSEISSINSTEDLEFSSSVGILLSCMGSVVGSGNIWRYPRICAQNSYSEGALGFIIVWIISLFVWSIPIIILEFAVGRFSRSGPLLSFQKFVGANMNFIGGWVCMVAFFISAYYSVVVGWCFYYLYYVCTIAQLPTDDTVSSEVFRRFTEETYLPLITHSMSIFCVGICIFGGLKWIERVSSILVSLLLIIVVITFGWSLSLPYSEIGIKFLFTINWDSLGNPKVWTDAFIQNAFDTGAGMGIFCAYSAYFRRDNGAVRYGVLLPIFNNLVSLVCGIAVFGTVFASLIGNRPYLTTTNIQQIMQDSGPGSTGLTFTWIPVLYSTMGIPGRILCALFFLCLSFAGLTTLISHLQLTKLTLQNCKVHHRFAACVALVLTFLVGIPSSLYIHVLNNQDSVWGFALIISGLMFSFLTIIYGAERFRKFVVNDFGHGDWYLPFIWSVFCAFIIPIEGTVFILWWAIRNSIMNPSWSILSPNSFILTLIEWMFLLAFLLVCNLIVVKCRLNIFAMDQPGGYDPYKLYDVPHFHRVVGYQLELVSEKNSSSETKIALHRIYKKEK